ncbi:5-formyltetrahydrofolate cyclo-ligase [Alicyclobacillus herbarius]|uniref:5-formyltetrahydrofolate cyclo-ligase n=1 Tax=Alicyclobacillus herbarius TaxID=122960 RepID=UPI0004097117|nr:5-formyltetrahydrofolate cyclo-ligase [Alicyclobacillus herbarius]
MAKTDGVWADKAAARAHFLHLRQGLADAHRADAESRVQARLVQMMKDMYGPHSVPRVAGFYAAVRGELDVTPAAAAWRRMGGISAYPRVCGKRQMQFLSVAGEDELQPGRFGILEPPPTAPEVAPADLAIIVVPALAYSQAGWRLGYGGGFYDTFFAQPAVRAVRIGVAFSEMVVETPQWLVDPFDEPVDFVITEEEVIVCSQRR